MEGCVESVFALQFGAPVLERDVVYQRLEPAVDVFLTVCAAAERLTHG